MCVCVYVCLHMCDMLLYKALTLLPNPRCCFCCAASLCLVIPCNDCRKRKAGICAHREMPAEYKIVYSLRYRRIIIYKDTAATCRYFPFMLTHFPIFFFNFHSKYQSCLSYQLMLSLSALYRVSFSRSCPTYFPLVFASTASPCGGFCLLSAFWLV